MYKRKTKKKQNKTKATPSQKKSKSKTLYFFPTFLFYLKAPSFLAAIARNMRAALFLAAPPVNVS